MVLSSAIVCDRDRRIADDRRSMFPYDRRRFADLIAICDLRSAIIWKPALRDTGILGKKSKCSYQESNLRHLRSDVLQLSYRRRVGTKTIKLGSWEKHPAYC